MSGERTARIDELFLAAVELPPGERAAWLAEACGDDVELLAEVKSLLVHDSADGPLRAAEAAVHGTIEQASREALVDLPETIGSYRIVGVLGTGGMGTVYEAEQERPRRTVALKVLRAGLATRRMLERFEWEAEVLGWLEHPGIARIFEAGTADTGQGSQPFFAMELVRGRPITEHALAAELDTRARLALMISVCRAVHHAHQKGVVHRDLKPANVLVDGDGRPKVLDFGVARAADSDLRATTLQTRAGEIIGTLPYMSPEQVSGDPAAVDTRSDVYALGVMTYELLTGRLPIDIAATPLPQAVHAIAHEEPSRLGSVHRSLRGDVETIVAKAIEKDRSRRYASALELADDLQRHLDDEPIVARPPSTFYQLRKFARRNRALAGALLVSFVALAAATVVSTALYLRADEARRVAESAGAAEREARELAQTSLERARAAETEAGEEARRASAQAAIAGREAAAANQVRRFLTDLFLEGRQVDGQSGRLTVRELIDRGAERAWTELSESPYLQADIMGVLGLVYASLGLYEEADPLLAESVRQARNRPGSDEHFLAVALLRLGKNRRDLGQYESAVELYEEVLAIGPDTAGVQPDEIAVTRRDLGMTLSRLGRPREARVHFERALELAGEATGLSDSFPLTVRQAFAETWRREGDLERALEEMLVVEAGMLELGRGEGSDMARLMVSFGDLLLGMGRLDEAEERLLHAKSIVEAGRIEPHPDFYLIDGQLARVALRRGDFDAAGERLAEVLAQQQARGWHDHPEASVTHFELGRVRLRQGRPAEAAKHQLRALEIVQESLGRDHSNRRPPLRELGTALTALAAQPWTGSGPAPWEPLLDRALEVLESAGHHGDASALLDATLQAAEGS